MNAENHCPKCQRTLPADSPRGLCPACLLAVGLGMPAKQNDLNLSPAPTTPSGKQLPPPSVYELAPLFPHLEIIEILGQGGMGTVYKAKQKKLDRLVALKIVRSDAAADPAFAERFNREARTLARMSHPNIVAVHDFGEVQTQWDDAGHSQPLFYFVMEFVDGANLRQLMNGQRLESQQALAIVPQVCEALQFAHDEGVVHRDIKPENILVDHRGRVKIADFGLAKLVAGSSDDFTLTGTHQVMGTPRYMAPEQMEGSHAVDHRADIYSLGVVFYEMLTGQVPAGHFDPPSHKADVDHRLDSIVLKAMARDPDRRFQRASEVRTQVESVGASPKMRSSNHNVDPVRAAGVPDRPVPQTVSEFLSYEAAATAGWFAGTQASTRKVPVTIRWLAPLLCVATIVTLFQPWLTTYITDVHATVRADRTVVAPLSNVTAIYLEFGPADIGLGALAVIVLVGLLILHLITTGAEAPRRSIVILRLLLGLYVLGVLLAYRYEVGQTPITVSANPGTGEVPTQILRPVDEYGRTTARLQHLEQVTRFTPWAISGFASMIALLVVNAVNLRSAVVGKPKPESTSVRKTPSDLTPFQLASRLLTTIGVILLLVAVVGGFLGMFTATVVTSQAQLEQIRRIGVIIMAFLAGNIVLGAFAFISGRLIKRGEWINMSRFVCVMVILCGNVTLPVTAPLAIWCLVVLSRIRQDFDFKTGKTRIRVVEGDSGVAVDCQESAAEPVGMAMTIPKSATTASPLGTALKPTWIGTPGFMLLAIGAIAILAMIAGLGILMLLKWDGAVTGGRSNELLVETQNGDVAAVIKLLDRGADPNATVPYQDSPLFFAVTKSDPTIVDALLEHGANVNVKNDYGVTPLMVACLRGDLETVELLISKGARINQRDAVTGPYTIYPRTGSINWPGEQMTPLMLAASQGYRAIVESLLDAGAESNLRDKDGKNAAELALERRYDELHDFIVLRTNRPPTELPSKGSSEQNAQ